MNRCSALLAPALLACACSTSWQAVPIDAGCREKVPESLAVAVVPKARVTARLERLPPSNEERQGALGELLLEAGCPESRLRLQTVPGSSQANVICSLPGESEELIVVGAHFDKVPEGQGAVDNWTGTSLLPSLYESIAARPRFYAYEFVGFAAEELGLRGSRQYVRSLRGDPKRTVRAMVNMDSLGVGVTKMEVNRSDPELVCNALEAARLLALPLQGMNVDRVGMTDSQSFRARGIQSLSIHSIDQEHVPVLNGPLDRLEEVDRDHLYTTYKLVAALLSLLDTTLREGAAER